MLRLVIALAVWVLSVGATWAEAPAEALPLEAQWLKGLASVIGTVGMPGVIAGLLYALRYQNTKHEAERADLQAALKDEQAYSRKIQEDRIAVGIASADRIATVAVSSSNAIATAAEKNAGLLAICHEIKEGVQPVDGELNRILANQDGLFGVLNGLAVKVGSGCRAA
jgi:hypothetical protein